MANKKNIRKGWFNPYQYNKNTYFDEDYEEPTYLSFKLEFGNWGASINDEEGDRILWEVQDKQYQTYDDLPMGLFNPNFSIPNTESYDTKLENVSHYSAVEYLYRRNEDTRAEYLQAFIKGWYDLQKNYQPYFQEINGLSKLFTVDVNKGMRIEEGSKITVKCLEDPIDQRIRYLLTLYRKAAWDDNWQRWILPDIYRYFHLYIYISENRLFHDTKNNFVEKINEDTVTASNEGAISYPESNYNNIQILTNIAENITADNYARMTLSNSGNHNITSGVMHTNTDMSMALVALNGFAPVTVLDCGPCEFDITSIGNYNDNYKINQADTHEMAFDIIVKNVHFYEKNPLMWRLTNDVVDSDANKNGLIFVKDLYNTSERQNYNNTINSFPKYIDQRFYNNDEVLQFLTGSEGNDPENGDHYKAVQNMLNLYTILKENYTGLSLSEATNLNSLSTFNSIFNNLKQEILGNRLASEYLFGVSAVNPTFLTGEYASQLWDAINSDLVDLYYKMQKNYEAMIHNWQYFDEIYEQTLGDRSWATELDGGPWGRLQGADLRAWIPRQDFVWPDMRSWIEDHNFVWPDLTSDIPEQDLTALDMQSVIIHQSMTGLNQDVEIPAQDMTGVEQPIDRSWSTEFDGWHPEDDSDKDINGKYLYKEADNKIKLVKVGIEQPEDRSWATELDGWHPENDSDKDRMLKLNYNIEIAPQEMVSPDLESDIPEQDLIALEQEEYAVKLNKVSPDKGSKLNLRIKDVKPQDSAIYNDLINVSLLDSEPSEIEDMTPMEFPEDNEKDAVMTPMKYDQYVPRGIMKVSVADPTDISNVTNIRNVKPDTGAYESPEISNVNGDHIIIPNKSEITGTAADLELTAEPNRNIKNVRPDLTMPESAMDMTGMAYDEYLPTDIKKVNVEMYTDIPKDIKPVSPDIYGYDSPEIKEVSVQLTGDINTKIQNVSVDMSSKPNTEIKEVSVQLTGDINTNIKNVTLEDSLPKNNNIKPVFLTESINNPEIKNITLEKDNTEISEIKQVVVEDKKYVFRGDFVKPDYTDPSPKNIQPVKLSDSIERRDTIDGPDMKYSEDRKPAIKDVRLIIDNHKTKIRDVELEKAPDKNNTAHLISSILELEKENKKLVTEVNKLKNKILESDMVTLEQPEDRSWATDLDGWSDKNDSDKNPNMPSLKEKKKKQANKKSIQGPKLTL